MWDKIFFKLELAPKFIPKYSKTEAFNICSYISFSYNTYIFLFNGPHCLTKEFYVSPNIRLKIEIYLPFVVLIKNFKHMFVRAWSRFKTAIQKSFQHSFWLYFIYSLNYIIKYSKFRHFSVIITIKIWKSKVCSSSKHF